MRVLGVSREVGHQHVETEVDAELIDHQHPAGPAEATKLRGEAHCEITVGSVIDDVRVQDVTT